MRLIGHLPTQTSAARFSALLHAEGISHELEAEPGGWGVWVHEEEHLEAARRQLSRFQAAPDDPELQVRIRQGRRGHAPDPQKRGRSLVFRREHIFRSRTGWTAWRLTLILMVLSIGLTLLVEAGSDLEAWLLISTRPGRFLPEVRAGQVWRLVTPIFLHAGLVHLAFNMFCLFQLGGLLETRLGAGRLGGLVLGLAVASNLGQYLHSGPLFCGMSGVVYGLLGYAWIRGRLDPGWGLMLHPQTVGIMLVWLAAGFIGLIPNMANLAHLTGLATGMACGYVAARRALRRL